MATSNSLSNQQALALKVVLLLASLLAFNVVYYSSSRESYKSLLPQSPVKDLLLTLGLPLIVFLYNIPRPDPLEIGPFRIRICLRNLPRVLQVVWKTEEYIPSYASPQERPLATKKTVQQLAGNGAIVELPPPHRPAISQTHAKSHVASTILENSIEDKCEPLQLAAPIYLCLRCRQSGHHIDQCPYPAGSDNEDWSQAIYDAETNWDTNIPASKLCFQCQMLNVTEMFDHPVDFRFRKHGKRGDHARLELYEYRDFWTTTTARTDKHTFHESDKDYFVDLGYSDSTYFRRDCAMCVLLFTLSPQCNDLNTKLLIIPEWVEHRQEPELRVPSARASYATCLYVSAVGKSNNCLVEDFLTLGGFSSGETLQLTHCADARNALCILGPPQMVKSPKVAGGRKVNKQVDYHLLRTWLESCDILHDTYCRRERSIQLRKIRLIDVDAYRVVQYPIDRTVDYLALSYVWGKGSQKCFSVGSKVEIVPATIRDAIAVTRNLGMQFLWVDSVCIDQKSDDDKPEQIKLMSAIYRGAYATIVALSGRCADSGLPRVNVTRIQKFPDTTFLQTSCTVDGICVGTVMPTLRQQIDRSTWATRAWTYQEALLSPRCIYFSQHQVYFECNIRQCCESIDDSASAFHSMTRETLSPLTYAEPAATLGRGLFRNPFLGYTEYSITQSMLRAQEVSQERTGYREVMRPPKQDFRGLLGYDQLISHYSNRKMSNQSDALNAVAGILQQLQEEYFYEKGFFHGIPCADIQLALLWKFRTSTRRLEFPSWTWAGHHGPMLEAYPKHIPPPSWLPTPLKICKADGGALTVLSEVTPELSDDDHLQDIQDQNPPEGLPWSPPNNPLEHKAGNIKTAQILFVHGIVLRLSFTEIEEEPPNNHFHQDSILTVTPCLGLPHQNGVWWRGTVMSMIANGVVYDECWRDGHTRNELNKHCDQMQDFLLVARNIDDDSHYRYHLLLLQEQCDSGTKLYSRTAVMCLKLRNPRLDFHLFDPRYKWVPLT